MEQMTYEQLLLYGALQHIERCVNVLQYASEAFEKLSPKQIQEVVDEFEKNVALFDHQKLCESATIYPSKAAVLIRRVSGCTVGVSGEETD